MRAAAEAASQPACPAPITITSKFSSKLAFIFLCRSSQISEKEWLRALFRPLFRQENATPRRALPELSPQLHPAEPTLPKRSGRRSHGAEDHNAERLL